MPTGTTSPARRAAVPLGDGTERGVFDHSRTADRLIAERFAWISSHAHEELDDAMGRLVFGDWSWRPCKPDPGQVWSPDKVAAFNRRRGL